MQQMLHNGPCKATHIEIYSSSNIHIAVLIFNHHLREGSKFCCINFYEQNCDA